MTDKGGKKKMEIKERVYTLVEMENFEGLCLARNGQKMDCPKVPIKCLCGEWCPAFHIDPSKEVNLYDSRTELKCGTTMSKTKVNLNCFPQPVSYEITDKE
jgi:hypothetical protein